MGLSCLYAPFDALRLIYICACRIYIGGTPGQRPVYGSKVTKSSCDMQGENLFLQCPSMSATAFEYKNFTAVDGANTI